MLKMSQVADGLLRNMEALVVGCQGGSRPHLRALHFGGAAKLARELTAFMNTGAIHRDKQGEESCLPYLRSLYYPKNGHLLRSEWNEPKHLTDWFVDMIVNATLSDALTAVSYDYDKLCEHYERDAPILVKVSMDRLIRGAKCLDEMDAESLAEIQLSEITSAMRTPSLDLPSGPSLVVKAPKSRQGRPKKLSTSSNSRGVLSTPTPTATILPRAMSEIESEPYKNGKTTEQNSSSNSTNLTSAISLSSSCPSLTETGFKRFLQSRNWSLPESETPPTISPTPPEVDPTAAAQTRTETPGAAFATKNFTKLGARPKVRGTDGFLSSPNTTPDPETTKTPVTNGNTLLSPPVTNGTRSKRLTHRRSASDTDVQMSLVKCLPNRSPQVNQITELNEEDYIEGYVEGPSYHVPSIFQSGTSFPHSCGSWSELRPPSGGWQFPQPAFKEQSLLNYIISGKFSQHQAPLDQDNAHLILAEAVIKGSGGGPVNIPKVISEPTKPEPGGHQGRSGRKRTIQGSTESTNGENIEDIIIELSVEEQGEAREHEKGFVKRSNSQFLLHNGSPIRERSAEATALQLLFNLRDPHQPKASELIYLVSEQDAPQELLPLPSRFVPFPSEVGSATNDKNPYEDDIPDGDENPEEDLAGATELRGTLFWAPPRPQLILRVHSKSNLKDGMKEQNYFCHDCGMKVQPAFIHTFRFCYYFGKYSCTTCHSNKTHVLPANIIHKWDFKEYRVSDFALNVLQRLSTDPLFEFQVLNPDIVRRVSKLRNAISLREQALKVAKYLTLCRFANSLTLELDDFLSIIEPGILSLKELCSIKSGNYAKNLKKQLEIATDHVLQCELCCARGFLCEGCRSGATLFPFQFSEVFQCQVCHACYHIKCVKDPCTKCIRRRERR